MDMGYALLPKLIQSESVNIIPYVTFVDEQGPHYDLVNQTYRDECLEENLCAICGETLGPRKIFIGGEYSCHNGLFLDAPYHPHCVNAAFHTFPHLTPFLPNILSPVDQELLKVGIYHTTGFKISRSPAGLMYAKAKHSIYLEWVDQDSLKKPPDECVQKNYSTVQSS